MQFWFGAIVTKYTNWNTISKNLSKNFLLLFDLEFCCRDMNTYFSLCLLPDQPPYWYVRASVFFLHVSLFSLKSYRSTVDQTLTCPIQFQYQLLPSTFLRVYCKATATEYLVFQVLLNNKYIRRIHTGL